jgi:uncharacterized protein YecT (DUF1311 family)
MSEKPKPSKRASLRKILFCGLAYFACFQPGAAVERELSKEYTLCLDKAGGVTSAMIDCITAELYHQDDRLNENYKKLMSTLAS